MELVKTDWRKAELSDRERSICACADKLAREPWAMTAADLEPLRTAGLDDLGIVHVAHVVGFFSYANRIADGLGCDLEPGMVAAKNGGKESGKS